MNNRLIIKQIISKGNLQKATGTVKSRAFGSLRDKEHMKILFYRENNRGTTPRS